jgi:hypothetical protein
VKFRTLLVGLVALGGQTVAAQTMEIRLRDETTRAPVVGAIVRLLDDRGAVAQGLSNETGWLLLRAPAAGSYRLKVDRIGWAGVMAGPFGLGAGETLRRELHLTSTRLDLPGLTVEGESGCNRSSQGGALAAALWEEIRKALTASLISGEGAPLPLHVREFSRDLDLSGRALREHLVLSKVFHGHTYSALSPAVLAKGGFVFPSGDRTMYAAPDAKSLLSEEFVAGHCFRAVPGDGMLVGLAFEPARDPRGIDVRGTLWVDRRTGELDFLEYRYTRLPDPLAKADLGGRVSFRRLPSGAWIVSSWHIRRPQLLREEFRGAGNTTQLRVRVTGYNDRGARVEIATDSLGRITRAIVRGRIYDSIAGKGLEDAIVYVEGIGDSIVTDTAGRFELAVAASGLRVVATRHRRVGLLGRPASLRVLLTPGDTTQADFSVPSLQTFARTLCGTTWMYSGLAGIIITADSAPAPGLEVRISWKAPTGERRDESAESGERGVFAMCGDLPPHRTLPLRVYDGKRPLMEYPVRLTGNGLLWVELRLPAER